MPRTTQDKDPRDRLLPPAKLEYAVHRELLWRVCAAFDTCVCPQQSCLADHDAIEELRILSGAPPLMNKIGHTMDGRGFRAEGWVCPRMHLFATVTIDTTGTRCSECGQRLERRDNE